LHYVANITNMTSHHATHPPHTHPHLPTQAATQAHDRTGLPAAAPLRAGVLAWPAWRRVLVVLPALMALWLAVAWAHGGLALW